MLPTAGSRRALGTSAAPVPPRLRAPSAASTATSARQPAPPASANTVPTTMMAPHLQQPLQRPHPRPWQHRPPRRCRRRRASGGTTGSARGEQRLRQALRRRHRRRQQAAASAPHAAAAHSTGRTGGPPRSAAPPTAHSAAGTEPHRRASTRSACATNAWAACSRCICRYRCCRLAAGAAHAAPRQQASKPPCQQARRHCHLRRRCHVRRRHKHRQAHLLARWPRARPPRGAPAQRAPTAAQVPVAARRPSMLPPACGAAHGGRASAAPRPLPCVTSARRRQGTRCTPQRARCA
eukprot:365013-Chlamydomonas_euryale.AAC.11